MDIEFAETASGEFIRREKRFFVVIKPTRGDFTTNEKGEFVAYCPNVGRMAGILTPGTECLFSRYEGKLKWKWEAVKENGVWVGTNTQNPNKLIENNLHKIFPKESFRREKSFGRYRADFASEKTVIEVKNVHWKVGDMALFPDCPTQRGTRQVEDLIELMASDYKCFLIYVLQRNDLKQLSVCVDSDPNYANNIKKATALGLKIMAFNCEISPKGINLLGQISYKAHI